MSFVFNESSFFYENLIFLAICKKSNQEYKCGTVCPKTCENYDQVISCTKQCVFGCHCENGYVLNENQECILPEQCPAKPCNF